jgi:TPP-dependent pyruvate/acetoin dehydrogenase alpha subunit
MNQTNEELYRTMYLIRACEEKIIKHYHENEMKTPVHLGIGAEAIYAGVCHALTAEDCIFGTYRNHGIYLARTGDTTKFFGELLGRECGQFRGRGGSMHLFSPENGFMASSAIVASTIPLAVGCAYSNKIQGNEKWVASFFGDGAMEEGVFWESINFASLHDLNIIFVCEDNGLAIHTKKEDRQGFDTGWLKLLFSFQENDQYVGSDPEQIMEEVRECRLDYGPSFLSFPYQREYEHCGTKQDWCVGYRKRIDIYDPLLLQGEKLSQYAIRDIETEVNRQIEDSWNKAKKSPTVMQ